MDTESIYQKAIKKLHHLTYGKFEHDENKAIELFDKLLSRGIKFHCDDVKRICQEVGYGEAASQEISQIYDYIDIYKRYKNGKIISCWTEKMIGELCE